MPQIRYGDKWILAKVEAAYGVDPAPVAGDGVRGMNLTRTPYEGSTVEREYDRASMGSYSMINVSPYTMVTVEVELAPAAAAAGAPAYDALLRACGLEVSDVAAEAAPAAWANNTNYAAGDKVTQSGGHFISLQAHMSDDGTNDPATDIAGAGAFWRAYTLVDAHKLYAPRDTNFESSTFHFFQGGNRQIINGVRGSMVISLARGELPKMAFTFMGLYKRPVTAARVQGSIAAYQVPIAFTKENTPVWSFAGNATQELSQLTITYGFETVWRDLVNATELVKQTDRKANWSAQVAGNDIADFNYYEILESHAGTVTLNELRLQHGKSAGRYIEIYSDAAQLSTMTDVESDKLLEYGISGPLTSEGTKEIELRYF